jgi:hypothetical protein
MKSLYVLLFTTVVLVVSLVAMTAAFGEGVSGNDWDFLCVDGCDNGSGCSWFTNKYTQWYPHQECQMRPGIGRILCTDGLTVLCYKQWSYQGYGGDCSGQWITYTEHYTAQCTAV